MRFDCCVGYSWGNNRLHFCLGPHSLGPAALCTNCLLSLGQPGQPGRGVSTWNDCTRKGEHAGSDWSQGQTAQVTSKPQWKVKLKKEKAQKLWGVWAHVCVFCCVTLGEVRSEVMGWEVKTHSTNFLPVVKKCFIKWWSSNNNKQIACFFSSRPYAVPPYYRFQWLGFCIQLFFLHYCWKCLRLDKAACCLMAERAHSRGWAQVLRSPWDRLCPCCVPVATALWAPASAGDCCWNTNTSN